MKVICICKHKFIYAFALIVVLFLPQSILAKTATEIFDTRSPSIVMVVAFDRNDKLSATESGVILSDGLVVTNCHAIKEANHLKVVHQQKDYPATVHHSDWDRDVCTLTVKGLRASAAPLGNTKTLKVGAKVYAIGAPQRLALTLLEGNISGLHEVEGGLYLQIVAPISPGSSGRALFDKDGQLVGLTTFYRAKKQNLYFAVPVEWIRELPGRHKTKTEKTDSLIVWLSRAIELKENKNWLAWIDHCQRWIKKRPKDIEAWYGLGDAYKEAGQLAKAIEALRKAVRINPEFVNTWFLLGNAYKESSRPDKAIEAFREAVRTNPDFGPAWFILGIHYSPGQPDKAIEAFREAVRINPEHANAWYGLGLAYGQSDQPDKEIEAYREALWINPEDADVWYSLGATYKITKQSEKAMEVYHRLKVVNAGKADELYEKYLMP
ncbi:MAG: tetratricopeptide repeat-containing serine protease family protein [Syntrophales bacterium]|nr:tetratricopeptide repeat-containing serine protease family protein [Syntrophales bacterium]